MKQEIGMDRLLPGERAVVRELKNGAQMRRRLQDLGLIEGTAVECVGVSPGGDPAAYLIRGAVIAIRKENARLITVVTDGGEREGSWD